MISTTNVPLDQKPQFTVEINNKGVGPAMIDTLDIAYKGHHFSDEQDYMRYLVEKGRFEKGTIRCFQRSALWRGG